MSRQDIADYLGLTIETVSRTFASFSRDGVIAIVQHGVDMLDHRKIERLAAT
jgi:CRP/FNR family transcriptional regulator